MKACLEQNTETKEKYIDGQSGFGAPMLGNDAGYESKFDGKYPIKGGPQDVFTDDDPWGCSY